MLMAGESALQRVWNSKDRLAGLVFLLAAALCLTPWGSPPIALALGIALALLISNPFGKEAKKLSGPLLRIAVVLLGFTMDLKVVLNAGANGAVFAAVTIVSTLTLGWALGRALKIAPRTSTLISTGTAICGGSAIAAVGAVLGAAEGEMSVALGAVFMLNAVALYLFPFIGHALNLSEQQFGTWAGVAIHDISSVVGAATVYGPGALATATAVKLSRALWIVPLAWMQFEIHKRAPKAAEQPEEPANRTPRPAVIGRPYVEQGMVGEREILQAKAQEMGIAYADLDRVTIDSSAIDSIPESLARRHSMIPVKRQDNNLYVAMVNTNNLQAIDDVQVASKCRVIPVLAVPGAIDDAIEKYYGGDAGHANSSADPSGAATGGFESEDDEPGIDPGANQAPIVRLANALIQQAITDGASEIEVEPRSKSIQVRYKVDDEWVDVMTIPKNLQPWLTARLEQMAEMEPAAEDQPRVGRIQFLQGEWLLDIRVSSTATPGGDKLLLRILEATAAPQPAVEGQTSGKMKVQIPWFIGLFLLAALVRSEIPGLAPAIPTLAYLAKAGMTLTLFLIGSSLSKSMLKTVGWKPLLQGLILWLFISTASLIIIMRF